MADTTLPVHLRLRRPEPRKLTHPVSARFVHHVWMMDVSLVKQFLGRSLFVAAVFDAFSRVPLAVQVLHRAPRAPWRGC